MLILYVYGILIYTMHFFAALTLSFSLNMNYIYLIFPKHICQIQSFSLGHAGTPISLPNKDNWEAP